MINAISSSMAGIMTATKKLDVAAGNIAADPVGGADLSTEILNSVEAKSDFQANAMVLSRANALQKALGSIFDETV